MKNVWLLFKSDIQSIKQNTITGLIILGLVILPSMFTWFNVMACWNVFDNTGNLKVAVANSDQGYKSDLVPLKVNVGEQVISELRANDQLNWVFTDEEDAIDGTKSGRYYGAVVIPESFSKDMMTFYSSDVQHATITYYSNEKKNAISPKVTDQGADKVSTEVNQVFVETLSEIGLAISSSLLQYSDNADVQNEVSKVSGRVTRMSTDMQSTAAALDSYGTILTISKKLVTDSGALVQQVGGSADAAVASVSSMKDETGTIAQVIDESLTSFSDVLSQSADSFEAVEKSIQHAFDTAATQAEAAAASLRSTASLVDDQIKEYEKLVGALESLKPSFPANVQPQVQGIIDRLNQTIVLQKQLRDGLYEAAQSVENGHGQTDGSFAKVTELAKQARASIQDAKADYDTNIKPNLIYLSGAIRDANALLRQVNASVHDTEGHMITASGSLADKLGVAEAQVKTMAADVRAASEELQNISTKMNEAIANNDVEALREIIGTDPSVLAAALSAPVALERHAVYPIENFGSAMTPLYTTLALWIGVLVMMVTLKMKPSHKSLALLHKPRPWQIFLGRFGTIGLLALMQATLMCVGNMLFLQVQVAHPLLYLVCFWTAGLVFSFIVYTLVSTFANLGKALAVFLLIIQVSGGGGSYPLQLLPGMVQAISPYLPITHAVNAMRAAMFGMYNGDFWLEIGILAAFVVPFIVIGLVLRKPLSLVVDAFVEKVESTKMM